MKYLVLFLLSLNFLFAQGSSLEELFKKHKLEGTIVIESLDSSKSYVYNQKRANTQLLPASTFKIPNTLIALESKLIKDDKEVIYWDGKKRFLNSWNKNQTLDTAFRSSCVWCYQYFAKQLSLETYENYLEKLSYGNMKTGKELTKFWLSGDIKISAYEQIKFLKKVYKEELPFEKKHFKLLKKIMLEEETENYTLRAKTGWATSVLPKHGWYVGFIETSNGVWFFATNLLIDDFKRLGLRKKITLEALKLQGIIQ